MHLLQLSDEILSNILVRACVRPLTCYKTESCPWMIPHKGHSTGNMSAILPPSSTAMQLVCKRFQNVVYCREFWQQSPVSLWQPRLGNPVVAHWITDMHLKAGALSLAYQPYFFNLVHLRVSACSCTGQWFTLSLACNHLVQVQLDIQALDHTALDLRGLVRLQTLTADSEADSRIGAVHLKAEPLNVQFPASLQKLRFFRPMTDSGWISLSSCSSLKQLSIYITSTPPVVLQHCLQFLQVTLLKSVVAAVKWAACLAVKAQVVNFFFFRDMHSVDPCSRISALHVYGKADPALLEGLQVHDLHVKLAKGGMLRLPTGLSTGRVAVADGHLVINTSQCLDLQHLTVVSLHRHGNSSWEFQQPCRLVNHCCEVRDGATTLTYKAR